MKYLPVLFCVFFLSADISPAQDDADWNSPNAIRPERQRIEIKEQVEISADVPGKITFLNPNARGGMVRKGEEVVRLDSRLVEAQLAEAEAKAESEVLIDYAKEALAAARHKLETKLKRNKQAGIDVFSPDEIKQLELEETKAAAELAKAKEDQHFAQLAALTKRTELEQYTIRAEIGGIVTDTHKKAVGSAVRQGDPIMTVVNLEKVLAILTVNPKYEHRINLGDTVLVRRRTGSVESELDDGGTVFGARRDPTPTKLPADGDETEAVETYVGTVTYIGDSNTDEENLFEVEAEIQNQKVGPGKYMLRKGSFIDARILSP
ncbi:MAG: HlyD family efflux transporter periplasmic adaptor subunit [Fuerstiella sp.]